ncbi:hypothetical protein ACFPRL_23745 [Pseudoclavibacter helvolus]
MQHIRRIAAHGDEVASPSQQAICLGLAASCSANEKIERYTHAYRVRTHPH